jgi:hypothetical protein
MGKHKTSGKKGGGAGEHAVAITAISAIVVLGIVGLVVFGPSLYSFFNPPAPAPTGTFSIVYKDGVTLETLDGNDIDCDEFRLPAGEDITNWGAFEQNTDVTDGHDVEAADFTVEFPTVIINVSCAGGMDRGDDEGVIYYARQQRIYPAQANIVYLYETPQATGFAIINSDTLALVVFPATNITENLNFTVVTAINLTQAYAKWESYWDYSTNALAELTWIFTANDTCAAADLLSLNGLTKTKPTLTTIAFSADSL